MSNIDGTAAAASVNFTLNAELTFPRTALSQTEIMTAITNAFVNVIVDSIGATTDRLTKEGGMPQFIKHDVDNATQKIVSETVESSGSEADDFVQEKFGVSFQLLFDNLMEDMEALTIEIQEKGRPGADKKNEAEIEADGMGIAGGKENMMIAGKVDGKTMTVGENSTMAVANTNAGGSEGEGNWFVALAMALGALMNKQTDEIQRLSTAVSEAFTDIAEVQAEQAELDTGDKDDSKVTIVEETRFKAMQKLQAEAQVFSMLAQVVQNVVSTIGQGLSTASRKQ